jgi:hypothetical protein
LALPKATGPLVDKHQEADPYDERRKRMLRIKLHIRFDLAVQSLSWIAALACWWRNQ